MGRVRVSRSERRSLEQIVRLQRVEARRYRCARMVLLAACGESISGIARQLGTCRCAWVNGLNGLNRRGFRGSMTVHVLDDQLRLPRSSATK